MTDLSSESLDQQLLKLQSAKDHLVHTRQLLRDQCSGAELQASDAKFAELIEALDADLAAIEQKKAQQQAAELAQQELLRREGELTQARSQLAEAQAEIKRLQQLNDEQRTAHTQAMADLAATTANKQEAEEEAELLLNQLHVVQEEFESLFLQLQESRKLQQQNDEALQQAKTDHEAAEQQAAQLTAQLQQEQAAKAAAEQNAAQQAEQLQKQLEESQQENELLLLQLHKVQEGLEQHFLDKQQLQHECETLQQRWARLELRQPGYLDYELIEPVVVDAVSDQPRIDWRIANITVMGQLQPELTFSTLLKDGQVGIVLGGIELFPRALRGSEATAAVAQFRRFGSRPWGQVLAAATALEQFFAGQPAVAPQLPFDPVFWRQVLLPLVAELRALPAMFRFDRVTLKRELVNPDYEHLWLVFEGASHARYRWPKLEVRLSAADVSPERFSRHPKLEFPLIDGNIKPFDSWYAESSDDFGGKLELRFDLDRDLMDLRVWAQLSPADRALVLALKGALAQALQQLQADKVAISRDWRDWEALQADMLQAVRKLAARQQKSEARRQA